MLFEEVSTEIQRDPAQDTPPAPAAPAAGQNAQALRDSLDRELRLLAERSARLSAD